MTKSVTLTWYYNILQLLMLTVVKISLRSSCLCFKSRHLHYLSHFHPESFPKLSHSDVLLLYDLTISVLLTGAHRFRRDRKRKRRGE